MSLRGLDQHHASTIQEHLDQHPDPDDLDRPYDEAESLTWRMAWLSRAAFQNPRSVAGGHPSEPGTPAPTRATGSPDPSSQASRPHGTHLEDVNSPAGSSGRAA